MTQFRPYAPGDEVGLAHILAWLGGGNSRTARYRIRYRCCGMVRNIIHRTLSDINRHGHTLCAACRSAERLKTHLPGGWQVGERIGPVTLIGFVSHHTWMMRWDCCQRETPVTVRHLRELHREVQQGQTPHCRNCANKLMAARRWEQRRVQQPSLPVQPIYLKPADVASDRQPAPDVVHAWPRPASLCHTVPIVWGAQP